MATKKKAAKRTKSSLNKKAGRKRAARGVKAAASAGGRSKTAQKKVAAKAKRKSPQASGKKSAPAKATTGSSRAKRKSKSTSAGKSAARKLVKKGAATRAAPAARRSGANSRVAPPVRKKSRRRASEPAVAASVAPEPPEPVVKTRLNEKQLQEFKETLLMKRRVLTGDVRNLTLDALGRDKTGDLSNMPIHMADIGSDNWEQEFTLGLIESEQQLVREIDDALRRIENRTYGICVATHKPIAIARLRAKPWAKYCIDYARQREKGRR